MSETMNDQQLKAIFALVGLRNGYDEVDAEFSPFRDLKIKWARAYKWVSFEVSDYLKDAPRDVMVSLAESVFKKMRGEDERMFSDKVKEWVTSDRFVTDHQGTYIQRMTGKGEGPIEDLFLSYMRLVRKGMVEYDPLIMLEWRKDGKTRHAGHCSILMRYVWLNNILREQEVSDELLDYCVYSQIVRIQMGWNNTGTSDAEEYKHRLDRFPERSRMEDELMEMGLKL